MTRKDYELIARAMHFVVTLPEQEEMEGATYHDGALDATTSLADALASQNPRFNRERFLKACGAES